MKNKTMRMLDAQKVYGEAPIFKEPRIIGDWVLWLEQRPNEKGRTTALIRPWGQNDLLPQELTPYPSDLRTKIHGYGGAPLTATLDGSDLILTWVDNTDNCLWMRTWSYEEENEQSSSFKFIESICALSSVASFPLPIVRAFLNIFKFQLVPCSQESRYLICSSDNISNSPPIKLNFVAAILISTSLGNVYTFDSSFL